MPDREKVIKGLKIERECVSRNCDRDCAKCDLVQDREWLLSVYDDALELLKEQELHELTKNEWEQWKNNPRRDPICMLWYKDTTPMWTLTPVEVHEPAYLMEKIKLFNRKPTIEEIQGVKWDD